MTPRPTRAAALALLAAAVLHLLTRVTGDAWLALASAAALGIVLTSLVLRPDLPGLELVLHGPGRVAAGAPLEQLLVVTNTGRGPSPAATWTDAAQGLEPAEIAVPALGPGESAELAISRLALRRGRYDGSSATLTTTAPFGTIRWTRRLPPGPALLVHPATDRGRPLRAGGAVVSESVSTAVAGSGTEVLGLRPWRPGDSSRAVSPRASARHGRPVVLERERDTGPALVVLATGGGAGAHWERQVSYAASVALAALREGRPVQLLAGEGGPAVPRHPDAVAVLDFFAALDPAGQLAVGPAQAALRGVHPGGTALVLEGRPGRSLEPGCPATCCHVEVLRA